MAIGHLDWVADFDPETIPSLGNTACLFIIGFPFP